MKKIFAYLIIAIALIQGSTVHAGKFGKLLKKALPFKRTSHNKQEVKASDEPTPLCTDEKESAQQKMTKKQKRGARGNLADYHCELLGW